MRLQNLHATIHQNSLTGITKQGGGGNVDDATTLLFTHHGNHLLAHEVHAVQVHIHHGIPLIVGHLMENAVTGNTCRDYFWFISTLVMATMFSGRASP